MGRLLTCISPSPSDLPLLERKFLSRVPVQGRLCNMQIGCEQTCIPERGKKSPFETPEHTAQRLGEDPARSGASAQVCLGCLCVCVGLCVRRGGGAVVLDKVFLAHLTPSRAIFLCACGYTHKLIRQHASPVSFSLLHSEKLVGKDIQE